MSKNASPTANEIWKQITVKNNEWNLSPLDDEILSEEVLAEIAYIINDTFSLGIVFALVHGIPNHGRSFDWNIGSILRHLDYELVVDTFAYIDDPTPYLESEGLAWVFGEYQCSHPKIIEFLYNQVTHAKNSDVWWKAAFSIEKLGLDDAINLLKKSFKKYNGKELSYYLCRLDDRRSLIAVLVLSNSDNLERVIYPGIRKQFLESDNKRVVTNCCWLIGRLGLIDAEILDKLIKLIDSDDYELRYYTFFALQNNVTGRLRPVFEKALGDKNPLIRKMAVRGLSTLSDARSLPALERLLLSEENDDVLPDVSKAVYCLKNPVCKQKVQLEKLSRRNENGMIGDESDKWYANPEFYDVFSVSEDPDNLCFDLIRRSLGNEIIKNPIDLACGTGKALRFILDNVAYDGTAYGVDSSPDMCRFLEKKIRRERRFVHPVKVINSKILEFPEIIDKKSSLVISFFGFPSRISNKANCVRELRAVYDMLDNNGIFYTVGWDERYNDEFTRMWFHFVPDDINSDDFEEWRRKKIEIVDSPRNCNLTWFKRGVVTPVQFGSVAEAARIIGHLFGRDAAKFVIKNDKTEWQMSLGITRNTRKDIKNILNEYEKRD